MKKILSLLLAFGLLTVPVLAEEPQAEPLPAWAWGEVAEIGRASCRERV